MGITRTLEPRGTHLTKDGHNLEATLPWEVMTFERMRPQGQPCWPSWRFFFLMFQPACSSELPWKQLATWTRLWTWSPLPVDSREVLSLLAVFLILLSNVGCDFPF